MPPRPKYQVFISSTYNDLHEERKAVTWAILSARHIPAGMENFTATDDRGWQTILSVINRSDYYVLILAGRYGSLDIDGLSWTEKEYEYAVSRKIPVLAFVRSKQSITADKMEDDPAQREKLESFKRRVMDKHLCGEWATTEELVGKVMNALSVHILDDEDVGRARPGWYRGDEMPASSTLDEFARLSEENSRLHKELAEVKSSAETSPRLMLVDHDEQPLPPEVKIERPLDTYQQPWGSLDEVPKEGGGLKFLALNTLVTLELGVQNISGSLVEHVIVDLLLKPVIGFTCGWQGVNLDEKGGRLLNSQVPHEYREQYPDLICRVAEDDLRIRLRIPRVPAGGTEYLPYIHVIGGVEGDRSWFNLSYKLVGSSGAPVVGRLQHEIMFSGTVSSDHFKMTRAVEKLQMGKGIGSLARMFITK